MRSLGTLVTALLAIGCTKSNPDYCESSTDCDDPSRPFCDVDGSYDGTANTCIPTPADAPDAGPPAIDAAPIDAACAPTTCEDEGKNCGEIDDNCGGTLQCGVCVLPLACSSQGTPNVCEGTCIPGEWTLDVADGSTPDVPTTVGIAIGPDGSLHAVHSANGLMVRYSHRATTTWAPETVDTAVSFVGRTAFAVDPSGSIHVVYYHTFPDSERYATAVTDGTWSAASFDDGSDDADTMVASPDGRLDVLFSNTPKLFQRTKLPGSAWSGRTEVLDGAMAHMVVMEDGTLHAAYVSGGNVRYATAPRDGAWAHELVAAGTSPPQIGVDASGTRHIAFHAGDGSLTYARAEVGGEWDIDTVDSAVGDNVALAVEPDGTVHVSYYKSSMLRLRYAVRSPSSGLWSTEQVDPSGDRGQDSDIAVDGAGGVHIIYSDETGSVLRYAYRCP